MPINFYRNADTYGEVEIPYATPPLLNVCPVNLCAFAMNASSDGSYVLVAPFNLSRTGGATAPDAAPADRAEVAETELVSPAQTARGGLSGVVSGADGSLLSEVLVVVVDPANDQIVRTALTDAAGQYVMPAGIPTGNFQVQFVTSLGHNTANAAFIDKAVPVATLDTQVTTLNATLEAGGAISGRVTNDSGAPLQEVLVLIYDATLSSVVSAAVTDADGAYTSDALASGSYIVEFQPLASGFDPSTGYVGEYHENQPLGAPPVPVAVAAPVDTTSVDGVLSRCPTCGAIDGRVTAQDGGAALPEVTVVIRNTSTGQQVAIETTDEDGRYHALVPSGTYSVEFFTDVSPLDDEPLVQRHLCRPEHYFGDGAQRSCQHQRRAGAGRADRRWRYSQRWRRAAAGSVRGGDECAAAGGHDDLYRRTGKLYHAGAAERQLYRDVPDGTVGIGAHARV